MRIHHLDCASMCPLARSATNGEGAFFERGAMPAHCLLIETERHGLVAVDTGIGERDVADPSGRLGRLFAGVVGIDPARTTTLLAHVKKLGLDPADVRHILVTHLDLDHAGGLSDFPNAWVHLHANEKHAALSPSWRERERYKPAHWAHGPRWRTYDTTGEPWRGFAAVRQLEGLPPEFLCVPMDGHTRGHWLVAVETPAGPLVHCGDAYFHRGAIEGTSMPWGIASFETLLAWDRKKIATNHARLRELARSQDPRSGPIRLFSAHDPVELERLQQGAP
jgi:glyoxylase-like metal-dependent hydrolase (beta-lactamase superfamily II)